MKQHAFFSRRLLFALALALCPLLACGSLSLAFAASVTITTTVGHDVHGNGKDTQGTPKDSPDATTTGNNVTVTGPGGNVTGDVYGGYAKPASGAATASGNTISVSGGTATGSVYGGGYAESGSGAATASGNKLTFHNVTLPSCTIFGGYANHGSGQVGTAINNIVTISGASDFSGTSLYGGRLGGSPAVGSDAFRGNTLNVKGAGMTVRQIVNFEKLNFYLPTTLAAGGTVLTVTSGALLTENQDGTGSSSIVNVGIDGAASPLQVGDQVVLIDASGGMLVTSPDLNKTADGTGMGMGMQGVTLKYAFDIKTESSQLLAILNTARVNEQTKALSEGFLGSLALTGLGADLAAGPGMSNAVNAARNAGGSAGAGLAPSFAGFGAVSGGSLRYNSGSHVDMNSVSMLAGLAWGVDTTPGRLTLGAFFEYGNGSYDTHNSFSNSASVDGDGDTYYTGGGVLGRMDFQNTGPGRFYTEVSGRMGRVHNEYGASDMDGNLGRDTNYDSSSLYYGLHLGAGYVWNITEAASLDLYGKYFWTRTEGDSVTLSTGDPVRFKDADSSRLRLGSRFAYTVNEYISPYIGAAYEHEFDGKARATTNGFAIDAPSLRGDTGIGEIGLTLKPSAAIPLSFDLGVQGYTGKREGVTGSLQIKFEF